MSMSKCWAGFTTEFSLEIKKESCELIVRKTLNFVVTFCMKV